MRAVVTGAVGFLGSHLCDRFLAEGWSVMGVDNLITGRKENLEHLKSNTKFSFEEANVSDGLQVSADVGYVLHFARKPAAGLSAGAIETMRVVGWNAERAGTGACERSEICSGFDQ
jgi:nucleoside-diphosphate-sugar epimerase